MLAKFREPRAFPLLIALLHQASEEIHELWEDSTSEAMGNLLASVWDGDLTPLQELLENPAVDEFVRSAAALGAFQTLFASGRMSGEAIESYFAELLDRELERTPGDVGNGLAGAVGDLGLVRLLPLVRKAFDEGLCDPFYDEFEFIETRALRGGHPEWQAAYQLVDDVIGEMENWSCFDPSVDGFDSLNPSLSRALQPTGSPLRPLVPVRVEPVAGRNDPCPCGSGKKFKKCCGDQAALMAKRAVQLAQPLRLRISLCGTDPEVWREVLVPGKYTLEDLHRLIQAVMPWDGSHLHRFSHAGKSSYGQRE